MIKRNIVAPIQFFSEIITNTPEKTVNSIFYNITQGSRATQCSDLQ